jgi:hypothetical protein
MGHHPLLAACDNTGEPLAWMLRPGSAGFGRVRPAATRPLVTCGSCARRSGRSRPRCAHLACWIEEAHVAELTGLLREGPDGEQLKAWPKAMRVFARRERHHPGAQLSLFETAGGWRYLLHSAGRLVRGGRRQILKIAATWPWSDEIATGWQRIHAIPHPL